MKKEVILSVVIPVYNGEKYLEALFSRLFDSLSDEIEVVFVDDGSSDASGKVIEDGVKKDNRIKYIRQNNLGASVARQSGIDACVGRYITFMDCDDYQSDTYFDDLLEIIKKNKRADIFVLGYRMICDGKIIFEGINREKVYSNTSEYVNDIMKGLIKGENAVWNHIYKMAFLKDNNIIFDANCKIAEDSLFNDLCILSKPYVVSSAYTGYYWTCGHDSLTSKCPENMCRILRKHLDNLDEIKEMYSLEEGIFFPYFVKSKEWAYSYQINNIINSNYSKRKKKELIKEAIDVLLDNDVINSYKSKTKTIILNLIKCKKMISLVFFLHYTERIILFLISLKNKTLSIVGVKK